MKLDKETIIKEHFWFLLGLALLLVLLSFVFLMSTASSAIADQEKTFVAQKKSLEGVSKGQPKNAEWRKSYEKRFELAGEQEKKIWERAWLDQANLSTWPENMPKPQLDVLTKLRFYDPIDDGAIRSTFAEDEHYKRQAAGLYGIVAPTQFNAGLRVVGEWTILPPTYEDMWLAQEDLWVQRGLLQIIRETNERLAALKEVKASGDKKKTFANGTWVLDLELLDVKGKPGLKYSLLNASTRKQVLPVTFQVYFGDLAFSLEVHGEPLGPGQSIGDQIPFQVQFANVRTLKSVNQLFDWRTVPVKRVDRVEMAYNSSRTGQNKLEPPLRFKAPETPADTSGAQPGGKMTPGFSMGGTDNTSLTANKLQRNRYIARSEQVRRMPVGLAVVIDQAHIQDFLASVANSPLRIQTTQMHWQRFHDDIKPRELETPPGGTPTPPGAPALPRMPAGGTGKGGGIPLPGATVGSQGPEREQGESGKSRPTAGPPRLQPTAPSFQPVSPVATAAADEQEWDLVNLAVYGIASLYEKYPPADATAAGNAK